MEKLSDDLVAQMLKRVKDSRDLRACGQVCSQWRRVEGLTRTSLRILDPLLLGQTLSRFPNLLKVEADLGVHDEDLACIAHSCPNLQFLHLDVNKYRRMMDICLSEEDAQDSISDEGLSAVAAACADLRIVTLRWRQALGDVGIKTMIMNCKFLAHLDLAHCKLVTDASLEAISEAPLLQVLILKSCTFITDIGLSVLTKGAVAKSLRDLNLNSCDRLTDLGVSYLKRLTGLQTLNLAECGPRITDTSGVAIATITCLRILNLSWLPNLSDVTVLALSENCTDLMELNLSGCELVTGAGLHSFSMHKSLQALCLASCPNLYVQDIVALCNLKYLVLDHSLKSWMTSDTVSCLQQRLEILWL
ncbi:hypothetical protein O6H91_16G064300 [Diphasiastrum complanatum]|uniref:Uncharacterized protein n=1 Tax=Diphasiastrum complanatum TaxID=34168 RepID=A0ACC2BCY1_DIPCM|nr:hypothetical protein O6H91_16G064300 [Diphasiastrum complanatum]